MYKYTRERMTKASEYRPFLHKQNSRDIEGVYYLRLCTIIELFLFTLTTYIYFYGNIT